MEEKKETKKKSYQSPSIRSEKEVGEPKFSCPTTSKKYCGTPFSPKKG